MGANCIIEIGYETAEACAPDGSEIVSGPVFDGLMNCTASGDNETACRDFLADFKVDFRITKKVNGEYKEASASGEDKRTVCEQIYWDSQTDFADEANSERYLVWQAAQDLLDSAHAQEESEEKSEEESEQCETYSADVYGVVDRQGIHHDVASSEEAAKKYAVANGYTQVSIRYDMGYFCDVISEWIDGKWVDLLLIEDGEKV